MIGVRARLPILAARVWQTLLWQAQFGGALAADAPATQTLDAGGVKINYWVQGAGEPVVLIHGWLSSAKINWDMPGTTALLAKDHKVVTYDVRGHGSSDKPTREEAYGPELVEDVVRLLDHLQIEKAHIVGYSMGGIVAGAFIAEHPDRVLSGTLGGMGWLKEGGFGQRAFAQIGKRDPNAAALTVCGRSLAKLALTEEQIKSIRAPMIVLVGDVDTPIKRLYVEPLQGARPDWPVHEIAGANHLNCIMKQQFRDEIADWLKKNAQ
jgi:hypothetical protein